MSGAAVTMKKEVRSGDSVTQGASRFASRENRTGIPTQLKERMEQSTGLSFDDVRVHYNSALPARLNALAYTQGNQVEIGPGQERHLPHELGHVVQQKLGAVRANATHSSGVAMNTDLGLERQADEIGAGKRIGIIEKMKHNVVQRCGEDQYQLPPPPPPNTQNSQKGRRGISGLSREELDTLLLYTSPAGKAINRHMRDPDNVIIQDDYKDVIPKLHEILKKQSLPEKMYLYRGTDASNLPGPFTSLDELKNQSFKEKGFLSTSKKESVAIGHATNVLLYITAPQGAHGICLRDFSKFPGEDEVLFDRKQKMLINKAEFIQKDELLKKFNKENPFHGGQQIEIPKPDIDSTPPASLFSSVGKTEGEKLFDEKQPIVRNNGGDGGFSEDVILRLHVTLMPKKKECQW